MVHKENFPEFNKIMILIGRRMRKARKEKGLLFKDILLRSGLPESQWRRAERGNRINVETLWRIAQMLDITMSELLGDIERLAKKVRVGHVAPGPRKRASRPTKNAARKRS